MLWILCSTRQIAEALLGTAELGEGELERLMAATREYSEMRVKGKFGAWLRRGPGWRCWKLDVKLTMKILRIGFGVFFFFAFVFCFFPRKHPHFRGFTIIFCYFVAICIGLFLILRPRLLWWILKGGVGKVWKTNVTLRSDEVSLFWCNVVIFFDATPLQEISVNFW